MRVLGLFPIFIIFEIILAPISPLPMTHTEPGSGGTLSEVALDAVNLVNSCLKRVIFDANVESFEPTLRRFLTGSPSKLTHVWSKERLNVSLWKNSLGSLPKHSPCFVIIYFLDPGLMKKVNPAELFFSNELFNMYEKASLILLVTTRASGLRNRAFLHWVTRFIFNDEPILELHDEQGRIQKLVMEGAE